METKLKTKRGRPASGVSMRWQAYCECGWTGGNWSGTGRSDAYSELRYHKQNDCPKTKEAK